MAIGVTTLKQSLFLVSISVIETQRAVTSGDGVDGFNAALSALLDYTAVSRQLSSRNGSFARAAFPRSRGTGRTRFAKFAKFRGR